jgi:hypothetical protein
MSGPRAEGLYANAEAIKARMLAKWTAWDEAEEKAATEESAAVESIEKVTETVFIRSSAQNPQGQSHHSTDPPLFVPAPEPLLESAPSPSTDLLAPEKDAESLSQLSETRKSLTINTTTTHAGDKRKRNVERDLQTSASPATAEPSPITQISPISGLPPIRKKTRTEDSARSKKIGDNMPAKTTVNTTVNPAKQTIATRRRSSTQEVEIGGAVTVDELPAWYTNLRTSNSRHAIQQGDRQKLDKLGRITELIKECRKLHLAKKSLATTFDKLRETLHEVEFLRVKAHFITQKRLLDKDRGLPQIFDTSVSDGVPYPQYLQDDAKLLFTRWHNEKFEVNLFTGIMNMIKSKGTKGPAIDPTHKKEWRYFGAHNLVNGQWWGSQLCAVRDGAHGSAMGGISGISGQGATSIVLSGDAYKDTDRDEGDQIWYSGTISSNDEVTTGTQNLINSTVTKFPVRVMRSAHLPDSNQYKPKKGFRFDGLYEVLSYRIIDASTKHYKFHLKRLQGQAPIRYAGVEARPTTHEMAMYDLDMRRYGWKGGVP